jgi:Zn-dependent peptidase ImmA (M78 family)
MALTAIETGNREARKLRRQLGLSSNQPVDPFWAAEQLGMVVVLKPFAARRLSGIHLYHSDAGVSIAIINNTDTKARQRFTLAHEIAHWIFDREETIIDDLSSTGDDLKEKRANCFASEFLLPRAAIAAWRPRRPWTDSPQDVAELALFYGTSFEATLWRLKNADCLSNDDVQALKLRYGELDGELRSRISERDEETIVLPQSFVDLVDRAFENGFISKGKRDELKRGAVEK